MKTITNLYNSFNSSNLSNSTNLANLSNPLPNDHSEISDTSAIFEPVPSDEPCLAASADRVRVSHATLSLKSRTRPTLSY